MSIVIETQSQLPEYNQTGVDYRKPMPRPKVRGIVYDCHVHLNAFAHAHDFFEAADHYGFDFFFSMTPLPEALSVQRQYGHRIHFITIPNWGEWQGDFISRWRRNIEAFYNMGSRIIKFWFAPVAIGDRKWRLDSPDFKLLLDDARARKMVVMSHIGDPELWYQGKYDPAKYGTRDDHYQMWENVLAQHDPNTPWLAAHMAGNPENLPHVQSLLDRYPFLYIDCSATKWMVREISRQRDAAREFFIRNQDRILFGTDQLTRDGRGYDFLASRNWCHRKLWETAFIGQTPILDPDVPLDDQPTLRGLALPDECLQKIYHDNPEKVLRSAGAL